MNCSPKLGESCLVDRAEPVDAVLLVISTRGGALAVAPRGPGGREPLSESVAPWAGFWPSVVLLGGRLGSGIIERHAAAWGVALEGLCRSDLALVFALRFGAHASDSEELLNVGIEFTPSGGKHALKVNDEF
jgi:hypothetical protein